MAIGIGTVPLISKASGTTYDGTLHETSAPYTPEQNGLAEKMNQTLSTLANTMLEESKLPKSFWADAMATAAYVTTRSPASGIDGKVPYQVLFN